MSVVEQIAAHEKAVLRSESRCYQPVCPLCHAKPPFARHEIRRRSFRCLEGDSVVRTRSWIVRWRCRGCHRSFTDYPPFALPHKRFVKDTIVALSGEFLGDSDSSYHRVTTAGEAPIEYASRSEHPPAFSRSTVWRWLSWLSKMPRTIQAATQLLYQKHPRLTLHREVWGISARKYRSESRRLCLQDAFRTLAVSRLFGMAFSRDMFPNFATAHGFL